VDPEITPIECSVVRFELVHRNHVWYQNHSAKSDKSNCWGDGTSSIEEFASVAFEHSWWVASRGRRTSKKQPVIKKGWHVVRIKGSCFLSLWGSFHCGSRIAVSLCSSSITFFPYVWETWTSAAISLSVAMWLPGWLDSAPCFKEFLMFIHDLQLLCDSCTIHHCCWCRDLRPLRWVGFQINAQKMTNVWRVPSEKILVQRGEHK